MVHVFSPERFPHLTGEPRFIDLMVLVYMIPVLRSSWPVDMMHVLVHSYVFTINIQCVLQANAGAVHPRGSPKVALS